MSGQDEAPGPVGRFANRGLAGVFLILAGGLCTGGSIHSFQTSMPGEPGVSLAFSQIALVVGAAPVIAGLIMIVIGLKGAPR